MVKFQVFHEIKSQNFLRGALPRTPPGYRPGPGAAPFETPARGPSPLDPGHPGKSHFPGHVRNLARFPHFTAQAAVSITTVDYFESDRGGKKPGTTY